MGLTGRVKLAGTGVEREMHDARHDGEAARPASIAAETTGSGRRTRLGAVVSWGRSASDADSSLWVSRLPRLFSLFFCQVTLIPAPLHSCSTRSSSSCCTSWLRGSWLLWLYASKLDTRWVGGASADGSLDHLPSASKLNILGGWGAPERAQAVWMFGVCRMPFFV